LFGVEGALSLALHVCSVSRRAIDEQL
jgi:hypothetical protein